MAPATTISSVLQGITSQTLVWEVSELAERERRGEMHPPSHSPTPPPVRRLAKSFSVTPSAVTKDGITLMPWSRGQMMVWDCTCVDTLAGSYITRTSQECVAAVKDTSEKEKRKYERLTAQGYIFKPLAFEALGPWGRETKEVIKSICKALVNFSDDKEAGSYLNQRLVISIQYANAAYILRTLPLGAVLLEETL